MSKTQLKAKRNDATANDNKWSNRGDYWLKKINPVKQYKPQKRKIIHKPLVLNGHGIKLNIDRGTLLIKCGFTHYPQIREKYRFFPNDRQLPSRLIILDGDGSITFDALEWLSEQNVPLVQIDWKGHIASIGGAHYAADSAIVDHQRKIKQSKQGFEYSKWLILEKINNSYKTIQHISNRSDIAKPILQKLKEQISKLKNTPPHNTASLLAIEGIAAAAYFRYLYTIPLKWRGLNRKPIPPEWHKIGTRIGTTGKNNQLASHPFNAILNYSYAVLENQVRGHLLIAGFDPTIGLIHSNFKDDRETLVFDMMEPVRPIMDKYILDFVTNRTFSPDDFILNKDGVVRLHPQLARYLVKSIQDIHDIETIANKSIQKLLRKKI